MEAKMKLLTKNEIQRLSFPDCIVEKMQFDIADRIVNIKTNIGYLSINEGINLKNCKLTLKNWQELRGSLYNSKTKKWEKLDIDNMEELIDICEFNYGKEITFSGFGKESGQWIELVFLNTILKVECD